MEMSAFETGATAALVIVVLLLLLLDHYGFFDRLDGIRPKRDEEHLGKRYVPRKHTNGR